jgi:NADPH-dependent F420 reductase
MKIAIIGTGNVGTAIGGSLVRAGHQVTFAARDTDKARAVASDVGAAGAASPADAARSADVIILAVPYLAAEQVAAELDGQAAGKVVIDATNPLKADYSGLSTEAGGSGAERFAQLLEGAHVVKAFNTLFASVQADPSGHGSALDLLYATDDPAAKSAVIELATSLGLRPVSVGPLAASRELEAMAWLNIRLQMISGGDWRSTFVLVDAPLAATAA